MLFFISYGQPCGTGTRSLVEAEVLAGTIPSIVYNMQTQTVIRPLKAVSITINQLYVVYREWNKLRISACVAVIRVPTCKKACSLHQND